eukprot:TRINITY_DN45399_c0_g1_i1.p2 TRINITY_DN45399_c0_g1~~TRINITY_DN45399_c0_g1_i1.p2  ORF type:complete len:109 (+),score=30.52 TRINITY_DN45399_c0_g1_i1:15-341(+)
MWSLVLNEISFYLFFFFFFKQKTAYEMQRGLVGSEMCIRDRYQRRVHGDGSPVIQVSVNADWRVRAIRNFEDFSSEISYGIQQDYQYNDVFEHFVYPFQIDFLQKMTV